MVVVVPEIKNHTEVVQQEVHTVEALVSRRDLGGSSCHAPNPGPTRLADPNRFPGRETQDWDSLPDFFFFLKANWHLWVWPTSYNRIKI